MRALLVLLALVLSGPAHAQGRDVAGRFDYYLLALSWSPAFCAQTGMRTREPLQCGQPKKFGFIVHGLWPQYERGYPGVCPASQPRDVPAELARRQLDLMPSPGLVQQQWDDHGVCAGLAQGAYFQTLRSLRAKVTIPPTFAVPEKPMTMSPAEMRSAFVNANPGLKPDGLALICDGGRLREVRLCFTRQGAPRSCGPDVRDRCRGRVSL